MSKITKAYEKLGDWNFYPCQLDVEFTQCLEEGLDIEPYRDLLFSIFSMPNSAEKEKAADALFDLICELPMRKDYPYTEPSEYDAIAAEAAHTKSVPVEKDDALRDRIAGAWLGRICGCLLGKPIEGMRLHELVPMLKEIGNYPMTRYVLDSDLTDEICAKYTFPLKNRCWADTVKAMPYDDDTNYTVLGNILIEKHGRDFTPVHVADLWIASQPRDAYFTAERVTFHNYVNGFYPPQTAVYKNPYREWIGAQIRGDYFGYINPGNTKAAAEMAFRDASISHIKNGIYGEMWASAMIAYAAVSDNVEEVILAGLSEIPAKSRLHESVMQIIENYRAGKTFEETMQQILSRWDDRRMHDWCHTISNAMIVAASLLYGEKDYGKSICLAVQSGFDTDCNGATVGSVLGMMLGTKAIGAEWTAPINDTLETPINGISSISISQLAEKTMQHIL